MTVLSTFAKNSGKTRRLWAELSTLSCPPSCRSFTFCNIPAVRSPLFYHFWESWRFREKQAALHRDPRSHVHTLRNPPDVRYSRLFPLLQKVQNDGFLSFLHFPETKTGLLTGRNDHFCSFSAPFLRMCQNDFSALFSSFDIKWWNRRPGAQGAPDQWNGWYRKWQNTSYNDFYSFNPGG